MRKISKHRTIFDLARVAIIIIAAVVFVATLSASPSAAKNGVKTSHGIAKPGYTVFKDSTSPTGHMVTFVYEDSSAESVEFSGNFYFAKPFENDPANITYYEPRDWEKDMFWYKPFSPIQASVPPYLEEMIKIEGTDYWTISFNLPCGNFLYRYIVDDVTITDPVNPPIIIQYEAVDPALNWSTAYVPFDENKQLYDMSFALPRKDWPRRSCSRKGRRIGTVLTATYEATDGTTQGLGIYLPFGYDANRSKPYPVLYLSHGIFGNEAHWFALANAQNIMDNLIADEGVEPTIVVTMNNQAFGEAADWHYDDIIANQMENIIPYMEENYNVSSDPQDRAYAGLSMGGMTTSNVMMSQPNDFGYFGIFSAADTSKSLNYYHPDAVEAMRKARIFIGVGIYDFAYTIYSSNPGMMDNILIPAMQDVLSRNFIPYDYLIVNGGHDWSTWRQLLYKFAKDILWK